MASFEDTVLALNPLNFWRLDELSGPDMVDIGSLASVGTFFPEADFGRPSPVETDSASTAIGKRVGLATAVAPTSGWSIGGWVFTTTGLDAYIICRNGQIGLGGGNFIAWDSGQHRIRTSTTNSVNEVNLTYPVPVENTWYWVMLTRNGAVVSLYVNDVLVDQSVSFSAASMDGGWVSLGTWKVGTGGDGGNLGNLGDAIDEVMVFDYPLSAAESLEIYESAINQILLHGRSDVVVTAVLLSDESPPPVRFPFRHNWDSQLIERISFLTAISGARTAAEENNGQRVVPRREFEFVQILKNHAERRRLRAQLWAQQANPWFVPVRQDGEWLSSALVAGATTIPVNPQYKDYEVGGYVGIRQLDDSGTITHWEEALITGLTTTVQCEGLLYDYSGSVMVCPTKRALMDTSISVTGHTDMIEEVTLTARLLPQDEAEVPNRITVWHPTLKYRDYEVFDPDVWQSNDWSENREYQIERDGEAIDFDAGLFSFESDTTGATEAMTYRMKLKGRDLISAYLGWFYERAGRLRYLWVPSMQSDFGVMSAVGDLLTVEDTNYTDNYAVAEPRRDVVFIYHDNTMVFRRVVSFRIIVNYEELTLDAPCPTLTNLRTVSLLKFCRLDGDQIELAWHTDDVVEVAWRFRELAHSPEGEGVSSLSPSPSFSGSFSPSLSGSPSPSLSPSVSPSGSGSPSASTSPSGSTSASTSPSVSPSHSTSPSGSQSPSTSTSPSASPSQSPSFSVSPSHSRSPSASVSPSSTPSSSASPST